MAWKRGLAAAWVIVLALPIAAVAPGTLGDLEPQALEPQAFSIPYVYRTMQGLQTNVIQPEVTYDHLHDVAWAPDGHMAIAVGSHNALVGYDAVNGTAKILRNGTLGNLYGVAWSDDSQVALAVGWNGALVEVSGGTITDLPPQGSTTWQAAAYVPGRGFLVVGDGGSAFFLNASARTAVAMPTVADLLGVAYSPVLGLALAVGRGGAAIEVTPGGAAVNVSSPTTEDLRSVGFESDTGVGRVAGGSGVLLSFAGGVLANQTHAAVDGGFYDISVTTSAEPAVVAVRNASNGHILFTNGTFDNNLELGTGLAGVEAVARSPTDGYVIGTGFFGMFVKAWQNGTWQNLSSPFRPVFTDGAWRPAGDLALLVGFNGTVVLFDRTTNATTAIAGPNTTASLRGVSWSQNGSEALIVGGYSLWRFDAASLNITLPVASPPDLYGVAFRPGGTDALLVGAAGYIGAWDGAALTKINSSVVQGLFTVRWHISGAVGDYAYAAGANLVARITPPSTVQSVVRIGTFFGVAFQGDDVWVAGTPHQIQRYDAGNGIWDNVSMPWSYNTTRFTRIVERPSGEGLLLVGNQSMSLYVNATKIVRFDTGFLADFNGVEYNPVTREPLFWGPGHLAFSMREGIIPNLPPIAQITSPGNGSNWTHVDTIRFDAASSFDYDDDALTFSWFDSASGFLTNGATLNTQLPPGNHTITVFVDDGHGHNVSASVAVFVSVFQFTPVAVISSPLSNDTPSDEDVIAFSAAGSYDSNAGDTLTYTWSSDHVGVFGNDSLVALRLPSATHLITLNVTDSTGRSAYASLLLAVHVANQPPAPAISSPRASGAYAANIPIVLDANGTGDPDSPSLTYLWLDGGAEIATGPYNTTFLNRGNHNITLIVSDGRKNAQITVNIDVLDPINLQPHFLSIFPPNGTVFSGSAVLNGTVDVDPAGPVRSVTLTAGGQLFTASGTIIWTLTLDTRLLENGPVTFTFRASDGTLSDVQVREYVIDNPAVNSPPTVSILVLHSGAVVTSDTEMAGSVDDLDSSAATVEYRLNGGPWQAANVTGSTWSVPIDADALPEGPVLFEVRAFDGTDYSAVSAVTVTVQHPAGPTAGFGDALLALAVIAVGLVGAIALIVWRRGRR